MTKIFVYWITLFFVLFCIVQVLAPNQEISTRVTILGDENALKESSVMVERTSAIGQLMSFKLTDNNYLIGLVCLVLLILIIWIIFVWRKKSRMKKIVEFKKKISGRGRKKRS